MVDNQLCYCGMPDNVVTHKIVGALTSGTQDMNFVIQEGGARRCRVLVERKRNHALQGVDRLSAKFVRIVHDEGFRMCSLPKIEHLCDDSKCSIRVTFYVS